MPWSPRQHRLFEFVEHQPAKAHAEGIDISQADASSMAGEGIKKKTGGISTVSGIRTFAQGGFAQPVQPIEPIGAPGARSGKLGMGGGNVNTMTTPFNPEGQTNLRSKLLAGVNQRIRQESNFQDAAGHTLGIMQNRVKHPMAKSPVMGNSMAVDTDAALPDGFQKDKLLDYLRMGGTQNRGQTGPLAPAFAFGGIVNPRQRTAVILAEKQRNGIGGQPHMGMGIGAPKMSLGLPKLGFAEGGDVEDLLPAAGLLATGLATRHIPRGVNAALRPFLRMAAKPVIGIEATSKTKLEPAVAKARFDLAREEAMSELANRSYSMGQGAWMGEHGMEYNPLFMQEMPRTFGDIVDRPDYLRYLAQMGSNLDQEGAPIMRFVPNAINTPMGANAIMAHGVDADPPEGASPRHSVVTSRSPTGRATKRWSSA